MARIATAEELRKAALQRAATEKQRQDAAAAQGAAAPATYEDYVRQQMQTRTGTAAPAQTQQANPFALTEDAVRMSQALLDSVKKVHPTTYTPYAGGGVRGMGLDLYNASAPATQRAMQGMSMQGYMPTNEQLNQLLSGEAYKPQISAWEYMTNYNDARRSIYKAVRDNRTLLDAASAAGRFDVPGNITPGNVNLVSDNYLSQQVNIKGGELAEAKERYRYQTLLRQTGNEANLSRHNAAWASGNPYLVQEYAYDAGYPDDEKGLASGRMGAGWAKQIADNVYQLYEENKEWYDSQGEYFGHSGLYDAYLDYRGVMEDANYIESAWDPTTEEYLAPSAEERLIGNILILNHIINGGDLQNYNEKEAVEWFDNLDEDDQDELFMWGLACFAGREEGFENVAWGNGNGDLNGPLTQIGNVAPLSFSAGVNELVGNVVDFFGGDDADLYRQRAEYHRMPDYVKAAEDKYDAATDEQRRRENVKSITDEVDQQIIAENFALTPEEEAAYRSELASDGYSDLMTSAEVIRYAYLKESDPSGEMAKEYYNVLKQTELMEARRLANKAETELFATDPLTSVPYFAASVAAKFPDAMMILQKWYQAVHDTDNPYNPVHDLAYLTTDVRSAQGEAIEGIDNGGAAGKALRFAYDAGSASADFLAMYALARGIGAAGGLSAKAVENITMLGMGAEAASSTMTQLADDDMPGGAKVVMSLSVGAIETAIERIGFGEFMANPRSALGYIAKVGHAEGMEEVLSKGAYMALDSLASTITATDSDFTELRKMYQASGNDDAYQDAFMDTVKEFCYEYALGFASGEIMGAPNAVNTAVTDYRTGARIKEGGNALPLMQMGTQMEAGSESQTLADEMMRKYKAFYDQQQAQAAAGEAETQAQVETPRAQVEEIQTAARTSDDAKAAETAQAKVETPRAQVEEIQTAARTSEDAKAKAEKGKVETPRAQVEEIQAAARESVNAKAEAAQAKVETPRAQVEEIQTAARESEHEQAAEAKQAQVETPRAQVEEIQMAARASDDAKAAPVEEKQPKTKQPKGKRPKEASSIKIGRLYRTMMAEAQSQHQSELTQRGVKAVEEAIGEKYRKLQLPESERYKPHAIARAIVDFGNDGQIKAYQQRNGEVVYDLTPEAKKTKVGRFIATHRVTMEIVNEYGSGNAEWAVDLSFDNMINKTRGAEQVEKLQELLPPSRREKARQAAEEKRRQERAEAEKQGVQTMEDVEADTRDEVDALTGRVNAKEAVSNKITFKKGDKPQVVGKLVRVEKNAGGEIQAVVRTPEGDTEVSMDELVQVGGTGVARVLVYAKHHSEMTTEEINALVGLTEKTAEQKVTSSQVIAAYEAGVRAGYAGEDKPALETVARTPYGDKAVQTLETAMEMGHGMGKRQAAADEKNRTEGISTRARGEGGVAFMGDVENTPDVTDTGVREDVETIMQDLTPQQNAAVRVLKTMSEASGIGITLFRTKVAEGEEIQTHNGFYDPNTNSIFIDLQAGVSRGGEAMVESAILKYAGHELTHFIEKNTKGEYAELRDAAKKLLKERGKSYAKLIDEKLRNLGNVNTRAQAEAEVIAEACEMMLKDSAAAEMMAKNNPSLWQKMTDWLKDFVAGFSRWVKRAFSGITATSEEAQALTEIRDGVERYIGDLQRLWDNALVVAAGREPAAETTEKKGDVVEEREFSERRRELQTESEEFKTWFGNSVVRNEDGSPKVVYHGTNGGEFWEFDWGHTQRADAGWYGRGHYFATGKGEAEAYGSRVLPVYLKIERPFVFEQEMYEYEGVNAHKLDNANVIADQMLFMINAATKLNKTFGKRTYRVYDNKTGKDIDIPWSDIGRMVEKAKADGEFDLLEYVDGTFKWSYNYNGWWPTTGKNSYASKEEANEGFINDALQMMFTERYSGKHVVSPEAYYIGGDTTTADRFTTELKEKGYDGVLQAERGDEIVVFDSTQVKSATDNVGTFDPANPDIRYSQRRGKPDLSVRDAMMAITNFTDMTPAEQSLLNRYQSNVLRLQEVTEAIAAQTAIRDNKETPEKERGKAKQELWRLRRQMFAIERALIDAEKEGGYAKLMTTAGEMVRLLTTKDSLPEVTQALQEQIAKVTEQLAAVQEELGEKSEEDMWSTIRSLFDQRKLRAAAKKLKERYGSRISEKTLMNRIVLMQTTLLRGGENATAEYMRLGEELVRELRSKSQQENDMLATLKEYIGTISLTDTQRQEINSQIGMKEFMSVVRPVVKVVPKGKGSVTLDVLLDEANAAEGGANPLLPYFEGHMSEGDSILHLYNLIKGAKTADTFVGRYGQEQLQAEMIDVMGIAAEAALVDAGAETVKTVMDALTKNAEGSDALTAKVRQLRVEMTKAGRAAGAAAWKADERHKAMGDVIEYLTHLEVQEKLLADLDTKRKIERQVADESNKRIKEIIAERNVMEENRVMRDRIRRTVGWMVTRIRRETDRKNVPEELKPYIEDAIRIFAEYNDVLRVFKKTEVAEIQKYFGALKKYDTKTEGKLNDLIAEELGEAFKELRVYLEEYGEASTKGHKKKTMLRNQSLKAIDEIVEILWGQITKWNEIFIGGKQAQLSDVAERTVAGLNTKGDYAIRDNVGGRVWAKVVEAARNKNMTPIYFFNMLEGNEVMQTMNDDVVKGQREYGVQLAAAKKKLEGIQAKYNYWAWKNADPLEFTTEQGRRTKDGKHDLSMTVDEAMSVWAIWKREQDTTPLFESTHLSEGGIVLNNGYRKVNGKLIKDETPNKLSEADMAVIDKWLTSEQKAYAEAIVEYMSKDMAEVGNRASMRMYGIRKFKEAHYFPMRVQRDQVAQSSNKAAKNPDANRIAGMSSAHRRVERAWKPLAISSFTEVAANHINEMLLYGNFAVPIENFNTILNYNYTKDPSGESKTGEDVSSMTVRALFRQKYGDSLTSYLETYLADLNGGTGVRENSKLMSLYKRSAVMASVSVMLQQPLSVIRAWYVQNPKYYLKALSGKTAAPERKEWEQLCKYSGAAVLKSIGGFDMTSTRTMGGYLAGTAEDTYSLAKKAGALVGVNAEGERLAGAKRQADELLGLGAQKADQMAWTYMWMAAKAEMAEQNPSMNTNSEEFLQMAAKRFEEVVNLTQVYDSTLVRSQNMRSKSVFAKMATSFMAEPTLTLNMLLDGYNRKDKKSIVKAAGIFVLSQLATAAVKSLWTAGRNDDEEKPWLEKYLAAMGGELGGYGGSLNPLNLIPYARDAMSLLEGYDVERADMALVDQLLNEATKWINGGYKDDPAKGAKNMAFALANMLGVPLKNIWRDVTTGINTWKDMTTDKRDVNVKVLRKEAMSNFLPWVDVSNDAYYTKLYEAMKKGDVKEVEALRVFLGTQGKDEDAVNSGVKGVVGELYLDKKLTEAEAKAFLLINGLVKDDKAAFRAVDGWTEKAEHKGEKDYSYGVYDTLHESIADYDAKAVEAEIKQLTANGWTDKEVRQELRSHVYEEYRKGNVTRSEAERILKQHGGYKAEEVSDPDFWYWTFREQDVKKTDPDEEFSRYDALYDALDKGSDAGVKAAVKELTAHGYTQQEAESKVYSRLIEQYRNGKMTWTQVQTLAKKHAGKGDLDANDWYWERRKQDWGKANGGSTDGYAKYADYYKAVETGVNIKTVTQEYLTHGIEAQELAANITKQYKEEYIRLYKTNKTAAANLQNRLLNAYTLLGYDRQKKIKDIAKWLE
nr:MAG TPA_asm: PolyVal ADP-Ribosyltransferase [Caudoviricetes sp.]